MKLIILDELILNSYDLPSSQKAYIINYKNEILEFKKNDNGWTLAANKNIELLSQGQVQPQVSLTEYNLISAKFKVLNKEVVMYTIPSIDNYTAYSLGDLSTITVGQLPESTIQYFNGLVKEQHAVIRVSNGVGTIDAYEHANVYVNNKNIRTGQLKIGDVIVIDGLKIIWMGTFIKVNNPGNKVKVNGLAPSVVKYALNKNFTPVTEAERITKLYKESDMFFHTPKQSTYIKSQTFNIDRPPQKEASMSTPIIFTIGTSLVVAASSSMTLINAIRGLQSGTSDKTNAYLEIGIAVLILFSSLVMPIILDWYSKLQAKGRERKRQKKYSQYLNTKKNEIANAIKLQESILRDKHLSLDIVEKQMMEQGYSFWSREIIDPDFLSVRLGVGNTPAAIEINAQLEDFTMDDDNLRDMVQKMMNQEYLLKDVPVSISLLKNRVTPIVNETNRFYDYVNTIMLQLLFYYSSIDLKLVLITNETNKDKWEYLKYTPHIWSEDREKRLFATNENEINQVSMYLEQVYNARVKAKGDDGAKNVDADTYKSFNEYYLIITDDYNSIKTLPIINRIINEEGNFGFSILIFSNSIKHIPSRLDKFAVIRDSSSGLYDKNVIDGTNIAFNVNYLNDNRIEKYAKKASNIPVSSRDVEAVIPSSVGFLEMYNVGKIEHLNILTRWKTNDPTTSLNAPLGVQTNNRLIGLDLHEKSHGPHGLIAGSTGSGKSEFIMTLILSLAVNYHPYELQFVLIDYKGGGLAGAFEKREKNIKIPHLVGTITNLDKSEMNRTLVSIKSELERRQRKFNEARDMLGEGTIDIYKYQRLYREGKVKEPMSHLVIISDEFAELKASQPEFMDELVSTARIGRSLGVHLILATQKPAGVVNEQIWSNSRFKICLKVQTTEDSFEMLKREEASKIKEAGRFYLQVGNDELFELGQSAWSGEKYIPKDIVLTKVNDSLDFINQEGSIIKSISDVVDKSKEEDHGEQLSNIVDYLYNLAVSENIKFSNLWLPNIPEFIYLGNLIKKYGFKPVPFDFNGIIGEYDKPAKQEQGLYTFRTNTANTLIFGTAGSGKELLLTTYLYSLCIYHSIQELNLYIIDFGSEVLRQFEKMPHVGNYINIDEHNKVPTLFLYLEKQIKKRKELFSEYRGSFDYYNEKSPYKAPLILTVINGYESFLEINEAYNDFLTHLLREGSKYGIVFMVSAISTNSVRSVLLEFYDNKIILKSNDPFDYQYLLKADYGLIPGPQYGRGLALVDDEACEFQTAYITVKEQINDTIKQTALRFLSTYKARVKGIKVMPKDTTFDQLDRQVKTIDSVPLGYELETADVVNYNFTAKPVTSIIGEEILDDISYIGTLIDLTDVIKGIKINIIDFADTINFEGNATYYNFEFVNVFNEILSNQAEVPTINYIIGYSSGVTALNEDELNAFRTILSNINGLKNNYFVIVDDISKISKLEDELFLSILDKENGIYIGNNIYRQEFYDVANLNQLDMESRVANKTYLITNGNSITLKGLGVSGDEFGG